MEPLSVDALVTAARWLRATNSAGETVPAFALVKSVGSETTDVYEADKPDADGQFVFVWGIQETPDGFVGTMTNDFPAYALYDAADGVPAVGETWGAGAGTFKLKRGEAGFLVVGDPDTTMEIVPVVREYSLGCCGPSAPSPTEPGSGSGGSGDSGSGDDYPTYPDGDGEDVPVVVGPPLVCLDGTRPVTSVRQQVVYDPVEDRLLLWPYDPQVVIDCCTDCDDAVGSGSGGSGGSGSGSGGGGGGAADGLCDAYTVDGTTLTRVGTRPVWRGGDYVLAVKSGRWTLDDRNSDGPAGPSCVWNVPYGESWDGLGCKTFAASRLSRILGCAATVEVCCDESGGGGGGGGGEGGYYDPCSRNLNATLYASLSGGEGTATLTWDGSTYWTGSRVLGCGSTLYFRVSITLGTTVYLEWSCNGSTWDGTGLGLATCTPFAVPPNIIDASNPVIGCGGACPSTLSVTISE